MGSERVCSGIGVLEGVLGIGKVSGIAGVSSTVGVADGTVKAAARFSRESSGEAIGGRSVGLFGALFGETGVLIVGVSFKMEGLSGSTINGVINQRWLSICCKATCLGCSSTPALRYKMRRTCPST